MGLGKIFRTLAGDRKVEDFTRVSSRDLVTAVTMEDELHTRLTAQRGEGGKWNLSVDGISRLYPAETYKNLNDSQIIDVMEAFDQKHKSGYGGNLGSFKKAVGAAYGPTELKGLAPHDIVDKLRGNPWQRPVPGQGF